MTKRHKKRAGVPLYLSFLTAMMATCCEGSVLDAKSSQVVVVITEKWDSPTGSLATFSRKNSIWSAQKERIPVTVGHKGLGWGLGLHPESSEEPKKREGDRRAPAGVFALEFGFGAAALRERAFPFRRVTDRDRWVDDPESLFYNQWVELGNPRFPKDWDSAEVMGRGDGLYDFVIVVGHNRNPIVPGRGSAIFLHSWVAPGRSTIGCTAMEKKEVKKLLQWLDQSANPILIQVPKLALDSLHLSDDLRGLIRENLFEEN
ncbi:MAG: L,D-transpeptidase family protein [Verrucomicrobiota bacterium]